LEATQALAGLQLLGPLRTGRVPRDMAAVPSMATANPEERAMFRRFTDPDDQKLANRWMAISLAVYVTLMLATVVVAHLTSTPGNDRVVQAPANATTIQPMVAR
jgi:hypothetical protein